MAIAKLHNSYRATKIVAYCYSAPLQHNKYLKYVFSENLL